MIFQEECTDPKTNTVTYGFLRTDKFSWDETKYMLQVALEECGGQAIIEFAEKEEDENLRAFSIDCSKGEVMIKDIDLLDEPKPFISICGCSQTLHDIFTLGIWCDTNTACIGRNMPDPNEEYEQKMEILRRESIELIDHLAEYMVYISATETALRRSFEFFNIAQGDKKTLSQEDITMIENFSGLCSYLGVAQISISTAQENPMFS